MKLVFSKNTDAMNLLPKLNAGETLTPNENSVIVRAAEQDLSSSWGDW